jgi:hypothetical protein
VSLDDNGPCWIGCQLTVLGEFDLTIEGSFRGIASFERSKSVNMIWPVSCNSMSFEKLRY